MVTKAAARTAAVCGVIVGLLVGLTACAGDDRRDSDPSAGQRESRSATASAASLPEHKVEVHLKAIQGAEGEFVAGVLFRAKAVSDIRHENAVGGFGVKVDDAPFSQVATMTDGSSGLIPDLNGPPADVNPGTYTLMMWQGPTLGAYSKWFPAAESGLTACLVQVRVGDSVVTTVTVTGFPKQPKPLDPETMRPCLD